jgi:hypothetical protein
VDRGRIVLWIDPSDVTSGAFVLRAERANDETASGRAPRGMRIEPIPTRAKALSPNFHRLAGYNRDGAVDEGQLEKEFTKAADEMAGPARALPEPVRKALLETLLPHVVRADHLSRRYRALRNFSARLWPTIAAAVVTLMAFQVVFLPAHYWLAWVELLVLVLGYVSYRVSIYDAWHEKWLNDRRLAEGLRSAMFIALVRSEEESSLERRRKLALEGLSDRIQDPLPFYSPANAWFVGVMKRLLAKERRHFASSLDLDDDDVRRVVSSFLKEAWIRDQAAYHEKHTKRRERIAARGKRLRLGMIGLLALVAIAHALGVGHEAVESASPFSRIDLWLAFLTVSLPAWAAGFHVLLSLDDHERFAERSSLMASLLNGLSDELAQIDSRSQLLQSVSEADRILDLESAEWAESLIDRRPEFTG